MVFNNMPTGVYIRTKEYRDKMSKAGKGRIVSEQTRKKISLSNKGVKPKPWTVEASVKSRKGKHLTDEHKKKIGRSGVDSKSWKGEDASYAAKHIWAKYWLNDPGSCECCGTKINLQWSNKDHKYQRVATDWKRLCAKCHRQYDDFTFGKREPWNKNKINIT
jgi:hypothetical protein